LERLYKKRPANPIKIPAAMDPTTIPVIAPEEIEDEAVDVSDVD
jgi:hypothetical protein